MKRLRSWFGRLYSSEGFRGPVVTLLSGTAVTLGISYLAVPILTRIFTPEQFGVSDYFVMMVSVATTFASLRYEDAMMLPEDDRQAASVFRLAAMLTIGMVVLIGIGSLWGAEIASFLQVDALAPWMWMLAPTLLFMRFGKLTELWLARQKAFRSITGGEIVNKTSMIGSRIGAGLATTLGAGGLIGGFLAGHVASAAYYAGALWKRAGVFFRREAGGTGLRSVATRYRRFPIYAAPAAALNAVVARLPIVLLPFYFGLEVVGLFGRAFVALAVPLSLVGSAVAQVFFVHAAEASRTGSIARLTATVHARLVMLGLFPTLILIVAGPDLFAFVFGSEWRDAGVFEQYLAMWFFLTTVASPLTRLFDVLEYQRTELLISIATTLALTVALVVGGRTGNVLLTMALIAAAGTLIRALQLATILKLAHVSFQKAIWPYVKFGLISLPLIAPVWLVRDAWPGWATALLAAGCGLIYLGVVVWNERLLD